MPDLAPIPLDDVNAGRDVVPDEPALRAFPVEPDATGYLCHGFRYGRWDDAAAFARLLQARPELRAARGPHTARPLVAAPLGPEAQRMKALGITWVDAQFRYGDYRYDRLDDAVAEAARARRAATGSTRG